MTMQPYQPPPPPRRLAGPPPPPLQPRIQETQHVVHAIVSFFTFGMWLPFWAVIAIAGANRRARQQYAYEQSYLAWQRAYWEWQHQA